MQMGTHLVCSELELQTVDRLLQFSYFLGIGLLISKSVQIYIITITFSAEYIYLCLLIALVVKISVSEVTIDFSNSLTHLLHSNSSTSFLSGVMCHSYPSFGGNCCMTA